MQQIYLTIKKIIDLKKKEKKEIELCQKKLTRKLKLQINYKKRKNEIIY